MVYSVLLWAYVAGEKQSLRGEIALLTTSSGLFALYDNALSSGIFSEDEYGSISTSLETTSTRIAIFSNHLFADLSKVDINKMSPLVPYSLYQAAILQHRLLTRTGEATYQVNLASLKMILGNFRKRWLVAGE